MAVPATLEEIQALYDPARLESRTPSSKRSLNAVHDTFDLIGGVPRLAVWANENPEKFYTKIWNRTVQTAQAVEHSGEVVIRTAIPRTAIDGDYEDVTPKRSD